MTKIYVAYGCWGWEGNDEPQYAGDDFAKAAESLGEVAQRLARYDEYFIDVWENGVKIETLKHRPEKPNDRR